MENITPSTINLDAIKNLIARIYGDGFTPSHYETLEKHISETRKAITVPRKKGWDQTDVVIPGRLTTDFRWWITTASTHSAATGTISRGLIPRRG